MAAVLSTSTVKYGFRIRTRTGMVIDNLTIHGRDEADAERKLRQMYLHCHVLECRAVGGAPRSDAMSYEDVLALVSR
jgi:hypothetical protein